MKYVILSVGIVVSLAATQRAGAQAFNDNCTNSTGCLTATNSSTASGSYGIATVAEGIALDAEGNGSSPAISAENTNGTGDGVDSKSKSGNGVYGQSTASTQTGVNGSNFATSGNAYGVYGYSASSSGYAVYANGNLAYTGTLSHVSDARLKKDVKTLEGSLDRVLELRGVSYSWKEPENHGGSNGRQTGFIAQEVEKVFPEWVGQDAEGTKTVSTDGLGAVLVESLRTLKTENDVLRTQSSELRDRVRALEAGRRPMVSGVGEGGIGLGLLAVAGAVVISRRKRLDDAIG